MNPRLGVVIVTHNHERTIGDVLRSILDQTCPPAATVVVDCGSQQRDWMNDWTRRPDLVVVDAGWNLGFSGGNNEGLRRLSPGIDLVLFLNPDVLMPRDLLERVLAFSVSARAGGLAAWSVRLLGWDFGARAPTGTVDSTGIFPYWNGWRDRRLGSPPASDAVEEVPALCGAFFMARREALQAVALPNGQIWDERYVAHKEDVELSLRLRKSGKRIAVWHGAEAWHGRGWPADRSSVPRALRLMAARNEVRLHADYAWHKFPMSVLKWMAVRWLDL